MIQRLFASGLSLDGLGRRLPGPLATRLDAVIDDLDATIGELRTTIFRLQSTEGSASLRSAVLDVAEAAAPSLGFTPTVVFEGAVDTVVAGRTDDQIVDDVRAATQEALRHAAQHARPEHVSIQVQATPQRLRLTITDDGPGRGGVAPCGGLPTLQRSAARRGGTSGLVGAPAGGTEVQWSIPLG